jgi:hypothetical protein
MAQDYRDTLDALSSEPSLGLLVSGLAGLAVVAAVAVWAVSTDMPRRAPALSVSATAAGTEIRFGPEAPAGAALLRRADHPGAQSVTTVAQADGSRLVRISPGAGAVAGPEEVWIVLPPETPLDHLLRSAGLRP